MAYPPYPSQTPQCQTLVPNVKKLFLQKLLTMTGAVVLLLIAALLIHWTVGLDVFLVPFESFGITLKPASVLLAFVLASIGIFLLMAVASYLSTGTARYEFYNDKLIAYLPTMFLFTSETEIPYAAIVKLSFNHDGVFNALLDSGTIRLELTGMKASQIDMPFIDQVEETAQYVQRLIDQAKMTKQAAFTEKYRVGGILDRERYY